MFVTSQAEIERTRRLLGNDFSQEDRPFLERSAGQERVEGGIDLLCVYAGLSSAERRKYLIALLIGTVLPASAFLGTGCFWLLALLPVPALIFQQTLKMKSIGRAKSFETDYTAMLLAVASAIRTGMDPLVALCSSAELFSENSELRREIGSVSEKLEAGESEEKALGEFGGTIEHPDIPLFSTAFILARREGSSLADCLQRLVRVTRQRQSFRRKIRSAVAMQKLSSFGIVGCSLAIGGIQAAMNPQALMSAVNHPMGLKAICLGIILMLFGLAWMLRMTRTRI